MYGIVAMEDWEAKYIEWRVYRPDKHLTVDLILTLLNEVVFRIHLDPVTPFAILALDQEVENWEPGLL